MDGLNEYTITEALKREIPKRVTSSTVLVPLVPDEIGGYGVLFEIRSQNVSQPGEVSFPGGHLEPGEEPVDAVRREVREELGIPESEIKILGMLPRERIHAGKRVRPFVGVISRMAADNLKISDEVAGTFEMPLSYFIENPPETYNYRMKMTIDEDLPPVLQNHLKVERPYGTTLYWDCGGKGLWGMTARILSNLLVLLRQ